MKKANVILLNRIKDRKKAPKSDEWKVIDIMREIHMANVDVANSLVYLNNPDRKYLIHWWTKHYPNTLMARLSCQSDFFRLLPLQYENYLKHCVFTGEPILYDSLYHKKLRLKLIPATIKK